MSDKGVPRPITAEHVVQQAITLRRLAGDGRDDLSREANRAAGLLMELREKFHWPDEQDPTRKALEAAYQSTDIFPQATRNGFIETLERIAKDAEDGKLEKVDALLARSLIEDIRKMPARSNQKLWEHLGGTGPAPSHFRPGYQALWDWFGLTYASFIVLPRVLMHEMPDPWQAQMALLMEQFYEVWKGSGLEEPLEFAVSAKQHNRFVTMPEELISYRHPRKEELEKYR